MNLPGKNLKKTGKRPKPVPEITSQCVNHVKKINCYVTLFFFLIVTFAQ